MRPWAKPIALSKQCKQNTGKQRYVMQCIATSSIVDVIINALTPPTISQSISSFELHCF